MDYVWARTGITGLSPDRLVGGGRQTAMPAEARYSLTALSHMARELPVFGYYKYSDITFEWFKGLPEDRAEQVKAFVYPGCIAHPNSPLVDEDGAIEVYVGTLVRNQGVVLLYTAAQVEYMRYFLYEMGLVPGPISLLHSSYLVMRDQLKTITPLRCCSDKELKKAYKDVQKANKKVKSMDADISNAKDDFQNARKLYHSEAGRRVTFAAVSFQVWERDHTDITEFGYSVARWDDGALVADRGHWIREGSNRNGNLLPDHRDNYLFGKTDAIRKGQFEDQIQAFFTKLFSREPVLLIVHEQNGTTRWLQSLGVPTKDLEDIIPDNTPESGAYIIDINKMLSGLRGTKMDPDLREESRCLGLKMFQYFGNAGNDAEYIAKCFVNMAGGLPLEAQRTARWPPKPVEVLVGSKKSRASEEEADDGPNVEEDPSAYLF